MSDWRAPNLEALCGSFIVLSGFCTALRLYVRKHQGVRVWWDDVFMMLSVVTFVGASICLFVGIHYQVVGYPGPPLYTIQVTPLSVKLNTAVRFISWANLAFVKLSALFFYKRLFDVPNPKSHIFRIALWTTVALVVIWFIAFMFATGFECGTHFSALWADPKTHQKYCKTFLPYNHAGVIIDVVLDVWIIILPIPCIYQLQMETSKKAATVGIFLLSAIGLAASIARVVVYTESDHISYKTLDVRQFDSRIMFYYILEAGMAIVAINLPVIAVVIFYNFPRAFMAQLRSIFSKCVSVTRQTDSEKRAISLEEGPTPGRISQEPNGEVNRSHNTTLQDKSFEYRTSDYSP